MNLRQLMKRSIIIAFLILAGVLGWIGSGQLTNVSDEDEDNSVNDQSSTYTNDRETYNENEDDNN